LGARDAAPDADRPRLGPHGAAARDSREALQRPVARPRRLPERRGRLARRRAGGGSRRDRGGGVERAREGVAGRRRLVGRGRPHGRGALGRARGRACARGDAPGLRAVRAAARERARPRRGRAGDRPRRRQRGRAVRGARARMTTLALVLLNVGLVAFFAWLLRRPNLLGYAKGGKWYLTWLSIGVITLMDELTSVFYAPAEAHRFIGHQAIFFIAFTSLLMRV